MAAVRRAFQSATILVIIFASRAELAAEPPSSDRPVIRNAPVVAEVDFERHVASLFGRLGCNAAACHGAFDGKGGFRLSLFGQSPEQDYAAIQDGRVDLDVPNDSLLLVKPSGREKHGGGVRFREDSWEYDLIRRWIADGARHRPGRGTVRELVVEPRNPALAVGESQTLHVRAHFAGGEHEDVTPFVEFRSHNETMVEVDPLGIVTARGPGDASVIVTYRGQFSGASVIVPFASSRSQALLPIANLIDEEVNAYLHRLGLAISPTATDDEFLRRATIDVLGTLPAPDEVRAFLTDADPNKRSKKIDFLLAHPRRSALWATKLCDITACNVAAMESPEELRPKWAKMWHDWFRRRFESNTPYDQIVRGVLLATSRNDQSIDAWIDGEIQLRHEAEAGFESDFAKRPSLDLFWRRIGPDGPVPVEDLAELAASAFLGLRMHCARCHQHPYDRWTQADFAGYANIFSRLQFGSSTELRSTMNKRLEARRQARQSGEGEMPAELPRLQEVFVSTSSRLLVDAAAAGSSPPKAPGGPALHGQSDPRQEFFAWLTKSDNPFFAKSFVNRVWAKYFGSGFVEPVDAFSPANPPRHSQLFDRLANEFVRSGYDIAHLERLILSSQTYQRSGVSTGNNAAARHSLASAPVRPLLAEALVDSLNAALETTDDFGKDAPRGSQAIELAPNKFADGSVNELFRILGRGDRKSLCDCDRTAAPTIRLPIYLMSHPRVLNKIRSGRLARLLDEGKADSEMIDEFYLATLSRLPDAGERDFVLQQVVTSGDRSVALADIVWALINTREFLTNH